MAEPSFEFSPDPRKLAKAIAGAGGPSGPFVKHLREELNNIGIVFVTRMQLRHLRGGTTATKLGKRTGALSQSLGHTAFGTGLDGLGVHVGFGPPAHPWFGGARKYAAVHEGLVPMPIRPKSRKFLSIPVQRTAGGDIQGPTSVPEIANPRFIPHVFKTGPGFLVFDGATLRFLLVRHVTIPARLNFRNEWKKMSGQVRRRMNNAVQRALAEISGQ